MTLHREWAKIDRVMMMHGGAEEWSDAAASLHGTARVQRALAKAGSFSAQDGLSAEVDAEGACATGAPLGQSRQPYVSLRWVFARHFGKRGDNSKIIVGHGKHRAVKVMPRRFPHSLPFSSIAPSARDERTLYNDGSSV
jgi:hypothetical protein